MHLQAGTLPLICSLVHRTLERNVDFLSSLPPPPIFMEISILFFLGKEEIMISDIPHP